MIPVAESTDLVTSYDNEVNPQTIPRPAWDELVRLHYEAHNAPMHRGHLHEMFASYLYGVADALELDRADLEQAVAIGWSWPGS